MHQRDQFVRGTRIQRRRQRQRDGKEYSSEHTIRFAHTHNHSQAHMNKWKLPRQRQLKKGYDFQERK